MIGILGGTFDPVHFGHLRPALDVMTALALEEVRLVPCHVPPHRPQPVASAEQRTAMLRMAVGERAGLVIDERELLRDGPSYTLDTLESLRADLPGKTLALMLGMDAFRGLTSWHRWHELVNHCHIVVMTRPDAELPVHGELADFIGLHRARKQEMLAAKSNGLVWFQTVTQLDISGTDLRRQLLAGQPADYLLPASVLGYIHSEAIYTG